MNNCCVITLKGVLYAVAKDHPTAIKIITNDLKEKLIKNININDFCFHPDTPIIEQP